jgi:hypothetical protein
MFPENRQRKCWKLNRWILGKEHRAEADAALKKLIDENADNSGSQIAQAYALRKEPEKMFEWLEHAWATHDGGVAEMLTNAFLRPYKDDPRFIAFAQKIGVMPKAGTSPWAPSAQTRQSRG